MDITLNQKDADYIANYCRTKMQTLDKNLTEAVEDIKKRTAKAEALAVLIDATSDEQVQEAIKKVKGSAEETIKSLQEDYKEEYEQLEKVLTIVMVGSE